MTGPEKRGVGIGPHLEEEAKPAAVAAAGMAALRKLQPALSGVKLYCGLHVNRSGKYVTAIVVAHLLVNIVHGMAHGKLDVGLDRAGSIFVVAVVLISPLLAMGLVWTVWKHPGLILLTLSMLAAFLFGLYHHFLAAGPDHVRSQPANPWGNAFVVTAYGLLVTEAIGTYVGVYFLCIAKAGSNDVVEP